MDKNFVKTSSEDTAQIMRKEGFVELPKEGNFFVFLNNEKMLFEENKETIYTNNLNMISN